MVCVEIILTIEKVKLQMYCLENTSQIYSEIKKENSIKIDTEVMQERRKLKYLLHNEGMSSSSPSCIFSGVNATSPIPALHSQKFS